MRLPAPPRARAALATLVLTGALSAAGCSQMGAWRAAPSADATAHTEAMAGVQAMLMGGAAAWNRGDLDAFMSDYVPGDEATYIGRNGIVRGRAAIRASYAPRFAPGVERGTLRFEQVEVDVLGPGVANAIAWYVLSRGDSVIARGPTSLVVRQSGSRWLIVHDHSS